jgi:hypothetical protein
MREEVSSDSSMAGKTQVAPPDEYFQNFFEVACKY